MSATHEAPAAAIAGDRRPEGERDGPLVLVSALGPSEGSRPAAAALACFAGGARPPLFIDVGGRTPRPTLLASGTARALESRLVACLPAATVAARGRVCHVATPPGTNGLAVAAAAVTAADGAPTIVHVKAAELQAMDLDRVALAFTAAVLRFDVGVDRAMAAPVVFGLFEHGLSVVMLQRRLDWVRERRALYGSLGHPDADVLPAACLQLLAQPETAPGG